MPRSSARFALLLAAALLVAACGEKSQETANTGLPFRTTPTTAATLPPGYRIESLLDGLDKPTSIAALPDGRLLITEQEAGRVRVVQDGRLLNEPWLEIPVSFYPRGYFQELGLVSIAVDPRFEENRYVYIYYSEDATDGPQTVFARLKDVNGHGEELTKLLTIPRAPGNQHIAGAIAFDGPDAILLGIGDHEFNALPDNPFVDQPDADPRVYAYGMRNPFGIAVDQESGRAFFTSNRDAAGDAVYELEAGADYGWPNHLLLREPLVLYDVSMGMAGIIAYHGSVLPDFDGGVFYCAFHTGGGLYWVNTGDLEGLDIPLRNRRIAPGCTTGLTEGADGFIYYLSFFEGRLLRIAGSPEAAQS